MKIHRLIAVAALAVAAFVACKEEAVATVTIDLGLANGGSLGFACTENRSPSCAAILECALKPLATAPNGCLSELCRADGGVNRECEIVTDCLRSGGGGPAECYAVGCERPRSLIDRARDGDGGGGAELHLLVDYISLGGTPGCRVSELRGWCQDGRCRPTRRRCIPVRLESSAFASPETWTKAIADGFAATDLLESNAPDEPVLVRIIGTATPGPCSPQEDIPAPLPADKIVGCAYSCPTVLSVARGALTVDFDVFGDQCTESLLSECVSVFTDAGAR